ncbi:uncharacterized protein J3R85_013882 [Psidium guajava]|nr:uncharacterized protein J3R85_013882 [Psidium guajava]
MLDTIGAQECRVSFSQGFSRHSSSAPSGLAMAISRLSLASFWGTGSHTAAHHTSRFKGKGI